MNRLTAIGVIGLFVPSLLMAKVEGTAQLGATQGLDNRAVLRLTIESPGEVIKICSSDDGQQEQNVGEAQIDSEPGAANPVRSERLGTEIVLFPPEPVPCEGQAFCPAGQRCFDRVRELPYDTLAAEERSDNTVCGIALMVQNTASKLGYCSAADTDVNWHEVVADTPGNWHIDFAGEPETLGSGGLSTRYFGVEIVREDGTVVNGGRLHAVQWLLNGHQTNSLNAGEFFIQRPVGDGAAVFVLDFVGLDGLRYTVVANDEGLNEFPDRSWCQYGNPNETKACTQDGDAELQLLYAKYPLYLNFPDPAPAAPTEPMLTAASFNDEVGTNSISPNDDGVQDQGTFSFEANMSAVYRIILDSNRDGLFSTLDDLVLRGDARPGINEVPWNGRGLDGNVLADGSYSVEFHLYAGETHFPLADVEENDAGLLVWRQDGPGLEARRPTPMFWDDRAVLDFPQPNTSLSSLPDGAFNEVRNWIQPEPNRPIVFDTWVFDAVSRVSELECRRCGAVVSEIVIGSDESADSDEDGLADDEEDLNGNGVIDPGETDPDNPDTDGDGLNDGAEALGDTDASRADTDGDRLSDGQEDRDLNGTVGGAETDPTNPDTDGDSLVDGAEDRNGNGVLDPDETDPLNADTDGDGLDDAFDPAPRDPEPPNPPETIFDPNQDGAFGGEIADDESTEDGLSGGGGEVARESVAFGQSDDMSQLTTRVQPEEEVGCDCKMPSNDRTPNAQFLVLCFGGFAFRWRFRARAARSRGNGQTP